MLLREIQREPQEPFVRHRGLRLKAVPPQDWMVATCGQERAHRPLREASGGDGLTGKALDIIVPVVVLDLGEEDVDTIRRSLEDLVEAGTVEHEKAADASLSVSLSRRCDDIVKMDVEPSSANRHRVLAAVHEADI